MPMGMGRYMAHSAGWYGYGWLFELIILALLFFIIYWFVKEAAKKNESAMDILNRRYAAGEISKKDYLALKKDIS